MKTRLTLVFGLFLSMWLSPPLLADFLADLARPHDGRSMRETSTGRLKADSEYGLKGDPDPRADVQGAGSARARTNAAQPGPHHRGT